MEEHIPSTRLARSLGDVLARIRYRGDSFVIEKNGVPVARLVPIEPQKGITLREFVRLWTARGPDPEFADALERVNAADEPAENPWA
jgi:prevent-host-death family protein